MPGFRSLVSFESISNCCTLPCGTSFTTFRSGAGTYFGPMTKLSCASSGGFSPSFSTLKSGAPLSSYLRTGCAAATPGQARAASRMSIDGLDMNPSIAGNLELRVVPQGKHSGIRVRRDDELPLVGEDQPHRSTARRGVILPWRGNETRGRSLPRRITHQRDYFDLGGMLCERLPLLGRLLPAFERMVN